jgi:hypothetical protein
MDGETTSPLRSAALGWYAARKALVAHCAAIVPDGGTEAHRVWDETLGALHEAVRDAERRLAGAIEGGR